MNQFFKSNVLRWISTLKEIVHNAQYFNSRQMVYIAYSCNKT